MTALYVASQNGHVEVVNILLQNGAHVDVQNELVSLKFHTVVLIGQRNGRQHNMYMTMMSLLYLMFIIIWTGQVESADDSILQWIY